MLYYEAAGKAGFYSSLINSGRPITQSLLDEATEIFETHAAITHEYANAFTAGQDPIALQSMYHDHLGQALSVAESYRTSLIR